MKINAGLNGNSKNYSGSYAGIMANTIESVGKLPLIKPMTMFYRAQKLPGYFHLLPAGSKKAIDDLSGLWHHRLAGARSSLKA